MSQRERSSGHGTRPGGESPGRHGPAGTRPDGVDRGHGEAGAQRRGDEATPGPTPPAALRKLLTLVLPAEDRRHLPEELDVLFAQRAERRGRRSATGWYVLQVLSFAVRLRGERFAPIGAEIGRLGAAALLELRFAARRLSQRPAYCATAVLTLAVGVGGVATVYSAANWVLLRPVPGVADPDTLVRIRLEQTNDGSAFAWPISHPDFLSLREGTLSLTALAASTAEAVHLQLDGGTLERLSAQLVTPNYFDVLGVAPAAGRTFTAAEHEGAAGPTEVVISERLWRRYWQRDRTAIGAELRVNGRPFTVIGVAPRGFHGAELPGAADAWFAASAIDVVRPEAGAAALSNRGEGLWGRGGGGQIVGRLAPGATMDTVTAETARVMELVRAEPGMHSFIVNTFVLRVYPGLGLSPYFIQQTRTTLAIVTVASLLLLLLAVINVTNLGLARGAGRRIDVATCRALGASRSRVAGGPLLEGLLLGAAGAAGGLAVCFLGIRLFQDAQLSTRGMSLDGTAGASLEGMTIDARVAIAVAVIALLAGLVAGLAPSLAAARQGALSWVRSGRHEQRGTVRLRAALVAAQVALSAVLLVGAGLLTRTVINLRNVDMGFDAEPVLTFSLEPSLQGYDEQRTLALVDELIERLEREPGVAAASIVQPALLQGWYITGALWRTGAGDEEQPVVMARFDASPAFLDVIGTRLIAGQRLSAAEGTGNEVLLSESAARAVFPGIDPVAAVGRTAQGSRRGDDPVTVAGIFEDARFVDVLDNADEIVLHARRGNFAVENVTVYLRAEVAPTTLFPRVQEVVREIAPDLPVFGLQTMAQQVDGRLVTQRLLARLATILSGTGLLLAAIGLYGVLGYTVAARTREIGVRSALGAGPAHLMRAVIGSGLGLAAAGAIVGLLAAAGFARFIAALLYGVTPLDLATYAGGLLLLLLVAAAASWIPARRAVRVSPVEALRGH